MSLLENPVVRKEVRNNIIIQITAPYEWLVLKRESLFIGLFFAFIFFWGRGVCWRKRKEFKRVYEQTRLLTKCYDAAAAAGCWLVM